MNERIKELVEEARITTNLDTDFFEKDINKWVQYYSERFAELIIKECIQVVEYKGQKTGIKHPVGFNLMDAAQDIKDHFGIQE